MSNERFGMDRKLAPKKCFCGARLTEPNCGIPPTFVLSIRHNTTAALKSLGHSSVWYISCIKCHTDYVWSFPNVWKERNMLPLFDTRKELK